MSQRADRIAQVIANHIPLVSIDKVFDTYPILHCLPVAIAQRGWLAILAGFEESYGADLGFMDSLKCAAAGSVGELQLEFPRL